MGEDTTTGALLLRKLFLLFGCSILTDVTSLVFRLSSIKDSREGSYSKLSSSSSLVSFFCTANPLNSQ